MRGLEAGAHAVKLRPGRGLSRPPPASRGVPRRPLFPPALRRSVRDLRVSVGSVSVGLAAHGPDGSMLGWRGMPGAARGQRGRLVQPTALFSWRTAPSTHRGTSASDHALLGDQTACPSRPRGRFAGGGRFHPRTWAQHCLIVDLPGHASVKCHHSFE